MASNQIEASLLIDINCHLPILSSQQSSFSEVWAVSAQERHQGSSLGSRTRTASSAPIAVRWQWVATPPFTNSAVKQAIEAATETGPRIIRLCPGLANFPLTSWLLSPLPEFCDAAGVAIALDFAPKDIAPWAEIVDLARRHPNLAIVVLGRGLGELSVMRSSLDATPNLILELSAISDAKWIERTIEEVGSHRFVFGSGGDPVHATMLLDQAGLTLEDANLVGSGVAKMLDLGSWSTTWL